ncbi:LysR family transcriptional regulator [Streptococcus sp. DD13]|uniref:LysR family transcriptional regulator n=1 Tax=Streptococcus sp. DD13 TaxID=1777881 RepID=UPI0007946F38|nr:LysR family transcriptional regulator [Streptococcus sp. DD13]KXT77854.1 putative transcriptional regulator [Streptococcus sp. DD13]
MLNLEELEQLVAFKELGTLSKVAEKFHISTPSLSRAMQQVEEDFGVTLFDRTANRIALNETGEVAVNVARRILQTSQQGIKEVRQFELGLKTIRVASVAPAPLWELLPQLSASFPHKHLHQQIGKETEVLASLENDTVDLAILPFPYEKEGAYSLPYLTENLFIAVTKDHTLADYDQVTFQDLNGYNFLLMNQIGFWDDLVHEEMPASKFLVQTNRFEFEELVQHSNLPRFTTDYSRKRHLIRDNRKVIPISDPQAQVTYYLVTSNPQLRLQDLISSIS